MCGREAKGLICPSMLFSLLAGRVQLYGHQGNYGICGWGAAGMLDIERIHQFGGA